MMERIYTLTKEMFQKKVPALMLAAALLVSPLLSPAFAHVNVSTEAASTYTAVEGSMIYTAPDVQSTDLSSALIGWYLIPAGLKTKLAEYNCIIYVTTDTSETSVGCAYPSRVSVYSETGVIAERLDDPYVVVSTSSTDITATVLHEVGHILDETIALCESGIYDGSYYKISDGAAWQDLYARYAGTLQSLDFRCSYICYDSGQTFAEIFRMYCEDPRTLASGCPEVFLYMQSVVEQYCG